jgi:hypothetical protein
MRNLFIALTLVALAAFLAPLAWAGEYDGVWEGDGIIDCANHGTEIIKPTINIVGGIITFEHQGRYGTYDLKGDVDRFGKIDSLYILGHQKIPVIRVHGQLFFTRGKLEFNGIKSVGGGTNRRLSRWYDPHQNFFKS